MIVETRSGGIVAAAKPRDPYAAYRVTPTDSLSGQGVTPESALALAAVHGAVSLIADANGIMPLEIIDTNKNAGERVVRYGWMQAMLQHEPNDDMSGVDLWTFVNACLLLRGNAYLAKLPQPDGTMQIYPMLPDYVTPFRGEDGRKTFRVRMYDGIGWQDEDYTPDAILHIKGRSLTDPLVGSSPIQCMRHFLGTQLAQQEYQAKAYADGLLIKGVLSTPQANITPEAADRIKAQWKQSAGGIAASHDVAVLHSGVTFQTIGLSPEDAQLIQTMRWGHTQIATAYKIPASRLNGEGASETYANQGQDDLFLDKQACLPYRAMIEAALNRDRQLFGAMSAWVPRFNPEIVLRADPMTRADVYVKLRSVGAISANEIRRFEDWSGIGPEGDDYTPTRVSGAPVPDGGGSRRAIDRVPEVHLHQSPQPITVQVPESRVDVHVPQQQPPVVHVEAAESPEIRVEQPAPVVHVSLPESPPPVVNVDVAAPDVRVDVAAPHVEVAAPNVQVDATIDMPKGRRNVTIERDGRGLITGANVEETQ